MKAINLADYRSRLELTRDRERHALDISSAAFVKAWTDAGEIQPANTHPPEKETDGGDEL